MTNKKRLHRLLVLIIPLLLLGVGMVSLYLSEPPTRVWVFHSHDAMNEQYKEYNQLFHNNQHNLVHNLLKFL